MSAGRDDDPRIEGIKSKIRVVPDFPKPGIMFQDITTLLLAPDAFKDTIDLFVERYRNKNISVVAALDQFGSVHVMSEVLNVVGGHCGSACRVILSRLSVPVVVASGSL
ncbi:hypothetical protein RJ639_026877 [Escallonia herrerae]|uniref:adenine phosphoribosyltransferase n=1 Tax=Escallonia herrerae TaxID=1293975 RepID=A0AA88XEU0_9ASTE|nr:hypothetical protein RJ639_026877 [Escallonia herrerae]